MAQTQSANELKKAYSYCHNVARAHYENFPVASYFLPKAMRDHIAAVYAFARLADDYADSPRLSAADKTSALQHLQMLLLNIQTNSLETLLLPGSTVIDENIISQQLVLALTHTVKLHKLPIQLLQDLLRAFIQDVHKNSYANFAELLDYCSLSANPIGRILLHFSKQDSLENLAYSDYICTSLQLLNFMQDLTLDLTELNRCYIPVNELQRMQVTIEQLTAKQNSAQINTLLKMQLDRISALYNQGIQLGANTHGCFGFEIRLIIAGAREILNALYARKNYYERPKLGWRNKFNMLMFALFPQFYATDNRVMVEE